MEEQMELFRDRSHSLEEPEMKKGIYKEMEPSWDLSSKEYDGKEVNIITFKDGKELSMPQIEYMFEKNKSAAEPIPSKATSKEILNFLNEKNPTREEFINYFSGKRLNKGGTPMLEKQMELFEDGGLRDEGGMVDEESGNEVPVGSTRKEVRDDIPAMLSEGEFVFPADVVRYIGLENLMRIRQDAKQGLKQMEAMGQMGNGDEAVLPDDMPFGMMDLIIIEGEEEEEEPQKKARGGVIHAQQGTFVTPMFDPSDQDVREYKNEAGDSLFIPFLGGEPVYPIPAGYFPAGQMPTETEAEAAPVDSGDDDRTPPPEPSEFQKAGGFGMDTSATDGKALDMWIKEAEKASTYGNVAAGIGVAINPLLGGMLALASKQQKKQIVDMLDEKIAQARKTPIKGQLDALEKIKTRLTTDEGKGILAKVIDEITGTVTDALGLSKAEKVTAKVGAGLGATQDPDEPDDKTTNTQQKVLNELAAKGYKLGSPDDDVPKGAFSFGNLEPKSGEEILEAVKAIPESGEQLEVGPATPVAPVAPETVETIPFEDQAPISAPKTPPSPTEIRDMAEQGARIRETTGTALETNATSDFNEGEVLAQNDELFYNNFRGFDNAEQAARKAKQQEEGTQTPTITDYQTKAAFGPLAVEAYTPEMSTTSTVTQQVQDYIGNLRSPISITGRSVYEKLDPRTTLEELTNKLAQSSSRGRGRDDEPSAPTTPAPTAYQPGQQRRKPRKDKDDDGPSFADKMQKTMQEKATESLKTADQKTAEVASKAKAGGASQAEVDKIKSEGAKIKEKLEQQSKGIKTGFKKGGLASRKK